MELHFVTVDVFTRRPFGGNPLAVVLNAEGLESGQMQKVAMEFGLPETTFVLPPEDPAHTARVRIFTPRSELPFAGHPNIGTGFVLATAGTTYGRGVTDPLLFEEEAGLVRIDLAREGESLTGARLAAPQRLTWGEEIPLEVVASACSIEVGDVETARHVPGLASCGLPFVMAELRSGAALAAASPRTEVFTEHLPEDRATGILLYVASAGAESDVRARMFAPLQGVPEDPATGSANVALIGLLAALHPDRDVALTKTILQGVEMGRPSVLEAEAEKRDGEVVATWIGGSCVRMMEGTLEVGQ